MGNISQEENPKNKNKLGKAANGIGYSI